MRQRWLLVPLVLGSLAPPARAIDVANGKLTVSGFGEWGYGRTSNENVYLLGTEEGSYENAQFGLTVTARPQDDLVVAGQLFVGRDGEVKLDWGFAEWRVDDLLRLRVGKVKNPLGLFTEVKDIGTLRPLYTLAQSVYGPTDFGAEAYLGAGVTGEWQGPSGWGLAYDAYFGALEIPTFDPGAAWALTPPASPIDFTAYPEQEALATDVVGGRLGLLTPYDGLTLRLSGYTGTFEQPRDLAAALGESQRIVALGVSAEWVIDRLQVRGEFFRATEGESGVHTGGYGEVAWSFLPKLQAAVRYEESHQNGTDVPAQYRKHREAVVGLSFWPSPNLVVKAEYHDVNGNRFAVPLVTAADQVVEEHTDLFVAGAQFSF
jgi:hypothetical protein